MRKADFGIIKETSPGCTARLAREIEAMGFDDLLCPDTQISRTAFIACYDRQVTQVCQERRCKNTDAIVIAPAVKKQ